MPSETMTIYSHRIDPCGVVALLRALDPGVQVVGPDDAPETATLTLTQPGIPDLLTLSIHHDPASYSSDEWPQQMLAMRSYFSRFPDNPRKSETLRLIATFRFALGLTLEPDLLPDGDVRLPYLHAVVRHLDGVLATLSALLDAEGRVLYGVDGRYDEHAVFPVVPPTHPRAEAVEVPDAVEQEPRPQTPESVARRALALAAVSVRAILEQDNPNDPETEAFREQILNWVDAVALADELEPDEWEILQRPVGRLERQQQINATWRLEGLVVLVWALKRCDLPPHDVLVRPDALVGAIHFLDDEAARGLIAEAVLRPTSELEWQARRLRGLHSRLREFTLHPRRLDFVGFAREGRFGPFDLSGIRLIGNDLAVGQDALADADASAVAAVYCAARERHLAINWILGRARVYSRTDTST